jgi:hypothetical protein
MHTVKLLDDPVAQDLLSSAIPARLAYVWPDGTPRVIPIWFHWNGEEVILCSPPRAPKMKALGLEARVALTIDSEAWPAKALLIRGTAKSQVVDGEIPEYAMIAQKYLGDGAAAWRELYRRISPRAVRIAVRPDWAAIIDVEGDRFPSAISSALAGTL